jgi:hypothetical protein
LSVVGRARCVNKKTAGATCGGIGYAWAILTQQQAPVRRPGKVIPGAKAEAELLTAGIHWGNLNEKPLAVKP